MTRYSLAIDIGGTFTDAVLLASDGQSYVDKTLTTHATCSMGFSGAWNLVAGQGRHRAGVRSMMIIVHMPNPTWSPTALIEAQGAAGGSLLAHRRLSRDVL